MKKDIHPTINKVIFRDISAGVDFFATSTASSANKESVDGVEYYVIPVDVSSASHPFYTGEENIIDTAGRVEKFKSRASKQALTGKKLRNENTKTSESPEVKVEKNIEETSKE